MSVNSVIDQVYVINLDKDTDRLERFDAQMKEFGINYTRIPAVLGSTLGESPQITAFCNRFCTDGVRGCALSHQNIWADMVKNSYKNVLIFEDDVVLKPDFNEIFSAAWNELPDEYDIFYLGCSILCDNSYAISRLVNTIYGSGPQRESEHINRVKGSIGLHAYILSNKCARKLSQLKINWAIDNEIVGWIAKYNLAAYASNPSIAFVNETGSGSNLSDSYPPLLNRVLHSIPVTEGAGIDHFTSENVFQIAGCALNVNQLVLMLCIFLVPYRYAPYFFLWLLLECIVSGNIRATGKFGGLLLIALGLKYWALKMWRYAKYRK